jgi:Ca2+-binding EF-hand superfamily protein
MDQDKLHNEKKLKAAFKMFDRNNDGSIAPEEVLEVFKGTELFDLKMA